MTSRLQRLGEALKPHILKPHTIRLDFAAWCLRKCKRNSESKKWLTSVQLVGTVCASEWHRKSVSEFQARLHAKALHRMPYEQFSIRSTRWKDNPRAILEKMVYLWMSNGLSDDTVDDTRALVVGSNHLLATLGSSSYCRAPTYFEVLLHCMSSSGTKWQQLVASKLHPPSCYTHATNPEDQENGGS